MRRNDYRKRGDAGEAPTATGIAMILMVLAAIGALAWLMFVGPLQVWFSVGGAW